MILTKINTKLYPKKNKEIEINNISIEKYKSMKENADFERNW